ncbi:OmpA family protein [Thermodesulfobacteriota bacterium]
MKAYRTKSLVLVMVTLLLVGCAAQQPLQKPKPWASFTAEDLNSKLKSSEYEQKVNTFLVVMDVSGSMLDAFKGMKKIDIAKGFVWRLDQTIPDLELTGGLRTLGQMFRNDSLLVYGMTSYSKGAPGAAAEGVHGGGMTPLGNALDKVSDDLKPAQGNIAVIVISDGKETDTKSVTAVQKIKAQYGDRLCIYTVLAGDDARGKELMEKIAQAGGCGFSINADQINSSDGMADFVEKVFLTRLPDADGDGVFDKFDKCPDTPKGVKVDAKGCPLDSDGDGVPDYLDQCPDTPKGVTVDTNGCPLDSDGDEVPDYLDQCPNTPKDVEVDKWGCPFDSDGDGVLDYMDECPDTPKGATVDKRGCWAYESILLFDLDSDKIKSDAYPMLDEAVSVLKKNPKIRVEIQGHTCNQGSPKYNMGLSEKRSRSVRDYFTSHGIEADRLTTTGYGLTRPAHPNDTEENRSKNRRVELKPIR